VSAAPNPTKSFVHRWLERRFADVLLRRFGGIQVCPWCRQWAQSEPGWHFRAWERDLFLDKLTCGVCGGTSLWRFEMGMIGISPLGPPKPAWSTVADYDLENARLRLEQYGLANASVRNELTNIPGKD